MPQNSARSTQRKRFLKKCLRDNLIFTRCTKFTRRNSKDKAKLPSLSRQNSSCFRTLAPLILVKTYLAKRMKRTLIARQNSGKTNLHLSLNFACVEIVSLFALTCSFVGKQFLAYTWTCFDSHGNLRELEKMSHVFSHFRVHSCRFSRLG